MDTVPTRKPPRAMLALITLATDLPVPEKISLYQSDDGTFRLVLDLATVADGRDWADHLHMSIRSYVGGDGMRYLGADSADWHGWRASLFASEPVSGGELADEQLAELAELAEAGR